MLAYRAIEEQKNMNQIKQEGNNNPVVLTHTLLEKVIKTFKSHRSAADTDFKWVNDVVGVMMKPIDVDE